MSKMPKATLVIPTLERSQVLLELLQSLDHQSEQDFETIIVDQSDFVDVDSEAYCEPHSRPMRYVHEYKKSLPNARNIGARLATTDLLIFIDDDVVLDPAFVEAHVERMRDETVGATAGRITGAYDSGPKGATQVGTYNYWTAKVTRNFHTDDSLESIDQLPGGNFSIRKQTYRRLSGFDSGIFRGPASIGEETDFACRLRERNLRIAFEPRASLEHLRAPRGGCRDTSRLRWTYWHGHNMAVLARRYGYWYTWPVFFGLQSVRYVFHALKRLNPLIWIAGVYGTIRGLANPWGR